MTEHETAYDYLAGCREPACVRARELRVRRFCRETGRPLPDDLKPTATVVDPRSDVCMACQVARHDLCNNRAWGGDCMCFHIWASTYA